MKIEYGWAATCPVWFHIGKNRKPAGTHSRKALTLE